MTRDNSITSAFLRGLASGRTAGQTIKATFTDGREAVYTSGLFSLLITDSDVTTIIDAETGELLHERTNEREAIA